MNHQPPLFRDSDTCLAEQARLIAQMRQDGRISRQSYQVFMERMAEVLRHRQTKQ